jgi:hypothetical protein
MSALFNPSARFRRMNLKVLFRKATSLISPVTGQPSSKP